MVYFVAYGCKKYCIVYNKYVFDIDLEVAMQNLKKVYFLIILATVIIAIFDVYYITTNSFDIIIEKGFYIKSIMLGCIFLIDIHIIKKIDEVLVAQLIKLNLVSETRREMIDKHEVSRKLQVMQSYVKMNKTVELEEYIISEINKD